MKKSVAEKLTARDPFVLQDCYANFWDLLEQQSRDFRMKASITKY